MATVQQTFFGLLDRFADWTGQPLPPLNVDALLTTALHQSGRTDFSDRSFIGALNCLVHALNEEATLSVFGRLAARFDILRCLNNQLQFDAVEEMVPGLNRRSITRPIFITGLPRSGSTFLHTLLSLDPHNAVPRSWQLIYPYPIGRRLASIDRRRARVARQFAFLHRLSPALSDMHPLTADAPQECTDITAQIFQSLRFDTTFRIPSYQRWIDTYGHLAAYRFHRRFLQHLDTQGVPGRQWVLKCPDHVFALDALQTVYPDAKLVMLHRDPLNVLASVAKLTELLRRPFSRQVRREDIGREVSARWLEGAERIVDAQTSGDDILHLYYHDVIGAPIETVRTLYHHCEIALSADAEARMRAYVRMRPSGGYGAHHHSLVEFGLDATQLRERFQRYVQTFDVMLDHRFANTNSNNTMCLA